MKIYANNFVNQLYSLIEISQQKTNAQVGTSLGALLKVWLLMLTPLLGIAQVEEDSLKQKVNRAIQAEFPRTRNFNLEYDHSFSRDFESEFADEDFTEGAIVNQQSVNFTANISVFSKNKWQVLAFGNYQHFQFEFQDLVSMSDNYPIAFSSNTRDYNYYSVGVSSTYYSSLFNKPFIYVGRLIADGSNKGFERIKGFVSGSIVLKRNAQTTITLGLLAVLDPSAQIPFSPLFSYFHKFKNSKWELDVILPQRILMKRPIGAKSRLSLGGTFGADAFYVNSDYTYLPDTYSYSQLKVDTGIIYEYQVAKNVITTFKGGIRNYISNRLTEKTTQTEDYIYRNDQDVTGYFNIGVSFNPFPIHVGQ
ncbi:DUF6268 family outer membrane beta-barrel protein [Mangrovimonas futianensis]|uniref:DUF6268 family outer membrane beta-barrel protein n=1 Tax=Mangrovimonas futianensis TaxID=2895523 RepID=UPI001E5E1566|nr:DUF6268 family outer membrane beta-barrel protein [Mangrovimonas futianensis]MCF1422897.1 DUF6268 family outer membrane beta-barrel protein [Mangrovimonas futianensis]